MSKKVIYIYISLYIYILCIFQPNANGCYFSYLLQVIIIFTKYNNKSHLFILYTTKYKMYLVVFPCYIHSNLGSI